MSLVVRTGSSFVTKSPLFFSGWSREATAELRLPESCVWRSECRRSVGLVAATATEPLAKGARTRKQEKVPRHRRNEE